MICVLLVTFTTFTDLYTELHVLPKHFTLVIIFSRLGVSLSLLVSSGCFSSIVVVYFVLTLLTLSNWSNVLYMFLDLSHNGAGGKVVGSKKAAVSSSESESSSNSEGSSDEESSSSEEEVRRKARKKRRSKRKVEKKRKKKTSRKSRQHKKHRRKKHKKQQRSI